MIQKSTDEVKERESGGAAARRPTTPVSSRERTVQSSPPPLERRRGEVIDIPWTSSSDIEPPPFLPCEPDATSCENKTTIAPRPSRYRFRRRNYYDEAPVDEHPKKKD